MIRVRPRDVAPMLRMLGGATVEGQLAAMLAYDIRTPADLGRVNRAAVSPGALARAARGGAAAIVARIAQQRARGAVPMSRTFQPGGEAGLAARAAANGVPIDIQRAAEMNQARCAEQERMRLR